MTAGLGEAQAHIDSLPEPRRSQMQRLHDIIRDALPDTDVRMWDYGGPLIGYGSYAYSNSKGAAGEWFPVGLASRKRYISLFSMAASPDRGYFVEEMHDRFPGTKIGRSCINITDPGLIDDAAVRDLPRRPTISSRTGCTGADTGPGPRLTETAVLSCRLAR